MFNFEDQFCFVFCKKRVGKGLESTHQIEHPLLRLQYYISLLLCSFTGMVSSVIHPFDTWTSWRKQIVALLGVGTRTRESAQDASDQRIVEWRGILTGGIRSKSSIVNVGQNAGYTDAGFPFFLFRKIQPKMKFQI